MYIKSMVIDGFKSYGQRTEIQGFDLAFNAITGLNGSGKSNILDAICFLLGITNLSHVSRNLNFLDLFDHFSRFNWYFRFERQIYKNLCTKMAKLVSPRPQFQSLLTIKIRLKVHWGMTNMTKSLLPDRLSLEARISTWSMAVISKTIAYKTFFDQFNWT